MDDLKKSPPRVESQLRHGILEMPEAIYSASGIVVNGRRLKSFVFTIWPSSATAMRTPSSPSIPLLPSRPSATPSSRALMFRSLQV